MHQWLRGMVDNFGTANSLECLIHRQQMALQLNHSDDTGIEPWLSAR